MARESTAAGRVKIQQRHSRLGKPLLWITIPEAAALWMGWRPGMYLTYYPTEARELVIVSEDQVLKHVSPDYDLGATRSLLKQVKGPRPGSMYEIEVKEENKRQKLLWKLGDPQSTYDPKLDPDSKHKGRGRGGSDEDDGGDGLFGDLDKMISDTSKRVAQGKLTKEEQAEEDRAAGRRLKKVKSPTKDRPRSRSRRR